MLIMDVIDKFYKKNTDLDYPFDIRFIRNNKRVNMYSTVSQHTADPYMVITGIYQFFG